MSIRSIRSIRNRSTVTLCVTLAAATFALLTGFAGCSGNYGGTSGPTSNTGLLGGSDFLSSGRTLSHFQAHQVDPRSEDSAGPQFVVSEDLDGDGLLDLVSAWNQSQPVQIHMQRRNALGQISFVTTTLAGNVPVVRVAGLGIADFDQDGAPDIAVLIKETALANSLCLEAESVEGGYDGVILLYLAPLDPTQIEQSLAWIETPVEASRLAGLRKNFAGPPEEEGYTSLALGDIDADGDIDMLAAWNDPCKPTDPKVLIFANQGSGPVRDGTWTAVPIPDPFEKGPRLSDETELDPVRIKDVALGDFDIDGDLDVVATYPDAASLNVRWYRNPVVDIPDDYHFTSTEWQTGTVGQIAPKVETFPGPFQDLGGADIVRVADIDRDGLLDVVVRSTGGRVIQWLKGPGVEATTAPLRNIPWQVYTVAEFSERTPAGMALGDLNGDGRLEVIASASGGLAFFDAGSAPGVYEQWSERLIVDDSPSQPATTDPNVSLGELVITTFINAILVVDLDGDGDNDLVATFDRSGLSGLSNDALVWFSNTLR